MKQIVRTHSDEWTYEADYWRSRGWSWEAPVRKALRATRERDVTSPPQLPPEGFSVAPQATRTDSDGSLDAVRNGPHYSCQVPLFDAIGRLFVPSVDVALAKSVPTESGICWGRSNAISSAANP